MMLPFFCVVFAACELLSHHPPYRHEVAPALPTLPVQGTAHRRPEISSKQRPSSTAPPSCWHGQVEVPPRDPWDKGFRSTRMPRRLRELVSLANKKFSSLDLRDLIYTPCFFGKICFGTTTNKLLPIPIPTTTSSTCLTKTDAWTNLSLLPRPPRRSLHLSPPPLPDIDLQQLHSCRTIPKICHVLPDYLPPLSSPWVGDVRFPCLLARSEQAGVHVHSC